MFGCWTAEGVSHPETTMDPQEGGSSLLGSLPAEVARPWCLVFHLLAAVHRPMLIDRIYCWSLGHTFTMLPGRHVGAVVLLSNVKTTGLG